MQTRTRLKHGLVVCAIAAVAVAVLTSLSPAGSTAPVAHAAEATPACAAVEPATETALMSAYRAAGTYPARQTNTAHGTPSARDGEHPADRVHRPRSVLDAADGPVPDDLPVRLPAHPHAARSDRAAVQVRRGGLEHGGAAARARRARSSHRTSTSTSTSGRNPGSTAICAAAPRTAGRAIRRRPRMRRCAASSRRPRPPMCRRVTSRASNRRSRTWACIRSTGACTTASKRSTTTRCCCTGASTANSSSSRLRSPSTTCRT